MTRWIGSILLAGWLIISTPLFSIIALLSSPLSAKIRYRIISQWSRLIILFCRIFCGIRYQVIGLDNLPSSPCVILSRHESAWETIAYQIIFPPQAIVLKKELLKIPFFGWGLARMSPIAIDRADGRQALRQIREQGRQRLQNGFYIIVFPEGTRMHPQQKRPYHIGGAWLAKETKVPVVPVYINSGLCWPKNGFFKKSGVITVRIGPPIISDNLSAKTINQQARQWIESANA